MPKQPFNPPAAHATADQVRYLEILLNDCGYTERKMRNAWLGAEVGREIHFVDDLTKEEASRLIGRLYHDRKETSDRKHGWAEEDEGN